MDHDPYVGARDPIVVGAVLASGADDPTTRWAAEAVLRASEHRRLPDPVAIARIVGWLAPRHVLLTWEIRALWGEITRHPIPTITIPESP